MCGCRYYKLNKYFSFLQEFSAGYWVPYIKYNSLMVKSCRFAVVCLAVLFVAGPGMAETTPAFSKTEKNILGAEARVTVFSGDDSAAGKLADKIFAQWQRLDAKYDFYSPDSELSRINAEAYKQDVKIDSETYALLEAGLSYGELTGGRFDITFSPLWQLWRDCAAQNRLPSPAEIADARKSVDYSAVVLNPQNMTVRFEKDVTVNLGGLIKEYALVKGRETIEASGVAASSALLSLGGNILIWESGEHTRASHGESWKIGIFDTEKPGQLAGRVDIPSGMVLTTAVFVRYIEIGGKKYCHVIDAKTGRPVEDFSGVTVYFPETSRFYSSTGIFLMGADKAADFISGVKGAAAVFFAGGKKPVVLSSPNAVAQWTFLNEPESLPLSPAATGYNSVK